MSPSRSPRAYYTADTAYDAARLQDAACAPLVISLRPANDHAAMRRAAAAHGLQVLALSPWRIAVRDDADTRRSLRAALAGDIVIATSPAAVRAAATLVALRARRGQAFCAVGSATAGALHRAGIREVHSPERMDSEGLLALEVLHAVRGLHVGLLTAPGGRDRIAPTLRARRAIVQRADVYARQPQPPSARAIARLRAFDGPLLLPVSSGEALLSTLAAVPADIATRLRDARTWVASERLADLAREAGCRDVRIADGPRPAQLLARVARAP
ncbi:MAG: uroporphyrinogen-III synthase [Lysobacter sp.]|nr:uroporphyrinogen-III synthase [Lysobacter sp.]